ncbi:MAG: glycoside hydrolase family 20 zincin-like fold domain-containing protein [Gemmatimonadales bacterium]
MPLASRILAAVIVAVALPSAALADDPHLIPKPREVTAGDLVLLTGPVNITTGPNDDDRFAARDLVETLKSRGMRAGTVDGGYRVALLRTDAPAARRALESSGLTFDDAMKAEGYVLIATKNAATVIAASSAGIFYGAQTLKQLIRTDGPAPHIQLASIRDWPAMKYRGFQDDLSRGPVPTLEFQKKELRTLAAYKINVYSPYYEHTLAYDANPLISPPGGGMSHADVRALVAYAKHYHMDVVPEQEAFGHLHHVLKYDLYSPLGETDHGNVLAPGDPAALPLIKSWFAEIDSLFPSKFVHLGADETFELGLGRTKDRVAQDGLGPVYIDFLKQIESTLRYSGKRFLFWGDIAQGSPDLVKSLPKDMVAVAWGYGANPNAERLLRPFLNAGMETWVAPGVSGWSRVYPNNDAALKNIQAMARDGQRLGAVGMLNTSWADDGEALLNQQWYGILYGAAASWQAGEASFDDFEHSFGLQFNGDATGKIDDAQMKLSAAHALLSKAGLGDANDYLYWLDPFSPEGQINAQKIRPVARDFRVLAESAMVLVAQARAKAGKSGLRETDALDAMEMGARRMDFIGMKFELADEISRFYTHAYDTVQVGGNPGHDLGEITSNINARSQDLRDGYVLGRELYEKSWLAENKPYWLGNVLNRYDLDAQLWIQRADKVGQARSAYGKTKKLPTPEEMGIPRWTQPFTP